MACFSARGQMIRDVNEFHIIIIGGINNSIYKMLITRVTVIIFFVSKIIICFIYKNVIISFYLYIIYAWNSYRIFSNEQMFVNTFIFFHLYLYVSLHFVSYVFLFPFHPTYNFRLISFPAYPVFGQHHAFSCFVIYRPTQYLQFPFP